MTYPSQGTMSTIQDTLLEQEDGATTQMLQTILIHPDANKPIPYQKNKKRYKCPGKYA